MNAVNKVINISAIIILSIIIFICSVILIDSAKNPDEIPSFFGWKPFIITENKVDDIETGDLVLVKEIDESKLQKNDIIAYKDIDNLVTICKISSINENTITVKIDNLDEEVNIAKNQVEGKYKHKIAMLGSIALDLQRPMVAGICLSIPIIIILISSLIDYKKEQKLMRIANERQENMQEEIKRLKKQNEALKQKVK